MSKRHILLALATTTLALGAQAQALDGTLKKVKESGTITLGIRESSFPLSYLDASQKPVGYHIDVCMKIVDAVKARLQLPKLTVNTQPVTSQNRIPLVTNGTIDLELRFHHEQPGPSEASCLCAYNLRHQRDDGGKEVLRHQEP